MGWFTERGITMFGLKRDDAKERRPVKLGPNVRGVGTFFGNPAATDDGLDDDGNEGFDEDADNDAEEPEEEDDAEPPVFGRTMFEFERRNLNLSGYKKQDAQEAELIMAYQANPTTETLAPILAANQDFLERKVRSASAVRIPTSVVRARIYNEFADQAKKWDPKYGAKLTTAYMNGGHRDASTYFKSFAQFGKAEKSRLSKMERIQNVAASLESEGREATSDLIAERTNFSLKDVRLALAESSKDLLGSKDLGESTSRDAQLRNAAMRIREYYTPLNAKIVTRIFNLDGKGFDTDNKRIADEVGAVPTHVSAQKKKIAQDLAAQLQLMGSNS